jgi:hypothetical protein
VFCCWITVCPKITVKKWHKMSTLSYPAPRGLPLSQGLPS